MKRKMIEKVKIIFFFGFVNVGRFYQCIIGSICIQLLYIYKELEFKLRIYVDYLKINRILYKYYKNKILIYDIVVKLKNICMYDLVDEFFCMGCQFVKKFLLVKIGIY